MLNNSKILMGSVLIISTLWSPLILAALTEIQNITPYNLSLTKKTYSQGAKCIPSCAKKLIPQASQLYQFSKGVGSITFEYDVMQENTKLTHFVIKVAPTSAIIISGTGVTITQGATANQIKYNAPVGNDTGSSLKPIWKSQFNDVKNWENNNWQITSAPSWGEQNIEIRPSSGDDTSPQGDNYMRVHFPKGSANPGSSPTLPLGGAQFYGAMYNSDAPITLSFYIRFPTNFPFLSSTHSPGTIGKLPGLYGGGGNTGTNMPTGYDGWTTRFMWCDYNKVTKEKLVGGGEVLQFTVKSNEEVGGTEYGIFLGCGDWMFKPDGVWHHIQQTIRLNQVGKSDGRIDVCYDGKLVLTQENITFRLTSALKISGILFQSFFGGSGAEYATPITTYADFASFALYPAPTTAGSCITPP